MRDREKPPVSCWDIWYSIVPALPVQVSHRSIDRVRRSHLGRGLVFWTTELPKLSKSLMTVLSGGVYIPPQGFTLYKPKHFKFPLPVLFGELFSDIISTETGTLRTDRRSSHIAKVIHAIRQLCELFYKLEMDPTVEQIRCGIESFVARNERCKNFDIQDLLVQHSSLRVAQVLVHRMLSDIDPMTIVPRHSAGAVAEGSSLPAISRWERQPIIQWDESLDKYYPYSEYGVVNLNHLVDELVDSTTSDVSQQRPARMTHVPKDARGPRWICCEPASHQFIQQGQMSLLYEVLKSKTIRSPFGGWIRLRDQMPLRAQSVMNDLAWVASMTGDQATLDLEAASDSIPWDLVTFLFPNNWVSALSASRTSSVLLPDGRTLKLHMAYPMGASNCFPVETIVFWALCAASCQRPKDVFAYGDDLIVPRSHVDSIIELLTDCGFTINQSKSFSSGHFRESCGTDWYDGYPVTINRIRNLPTSKSGPSTKTSASWFTTETSKFVTQIMNMIGNGLLHDFVMRPSLRSVLTSLPCSIRGIRHTQFRTEFGGPEIPLTLSESHRVLSPKSGYRYSVALQRYEHRIPTFGARPVKAVTGWNGVLRYLLSTPLTTSKVQGVVSEDRRDLEPWGLGYRPSGLHWCWAPA